MKRINKLPLMAFALGLGFVTVMGMSSFKGTRAVQWTFKGSSTGQILSAGQYEQGLPAPMGCGSGANLPCIVNFPNGTDDAEALEDYLTAPGRTNSDVLALSPQKRN